MTLFPIKVVGKVAMYQGTDNIVCDNTDYGLSFNFADSDFTSAGTKCLVLITDKGQYDPIPFSGTVCGLPAFGIDDGASVKIGLYEGNLVTTTAAEILLVPSILGAAGATGESTTPTITDAEDVADEDYMILLPNGGQKSFVPVGTLKEVFGGGTGGDSHWTKDENNYLVPDSDINLDGREILSAAIIVYGDDPATDPCGMTYRRVNALPQTAPTTEAEKLVLLTTDNHYYYYAGGAWKKLVCADDAVLTEKYVKPQSGIPKTDLASDVQTSLGKADSALQEHQSLAAYRTAAAQDVIDGAQDTAIAAKYSKPAGGIPASDLASGVIPDVSGKEDKSNKVTSLSSSSTDAQYPSAKCVYDAIIGAIEEAY